MSLTAEGQGEKVLEAVVVAAEAEVLVPSGVLVALIPKELVAIQPSKERLKETV